jgi:thymidylate synthase (FAD)
MEFERKILDHGYLKFVDKWGSDESIIEAARMSTGKGFLGWEPGPCPLCSQDMEDGTDLAATRGRGCFACDQLGTIRGDKHLLKFLYDKHHSTPFEMGGAVIEVQAPIFVFREWHRHRTQSYNEMSARYTPLPDLNYIPTVERLMMNSKTNKQAGVVKGAAELTEAMAEDFRVALERSYRAAETLYGDALRAGVPKELARVHLPVGRYSRMRASANLRNWLAFLTLRCDPAAQYEIRQFANAMSELIGQLFPRTHELFVGSAK